MLQFTIHTLYILASTGLTILVSALTMAILINFVFTDEDERN